MLQHEIICTPGDNQGHSGRSVPLSDFVDYVNSMHVDRDALFEEEYKVSVYSLSHIP